MYRIVQQTEKKFDALRLADLEAIRLAHADLSKRLEGFPQQFATKQEMDSAAKDLQKLQKEALSREIYDQNHRILTELVNKIDREKLPESVFDTFIDNYRIEQDAAATERRAVAGALATQTERRQGASSTWKQIAGVIGTASVVITLVISLVVLWANHHL